jgi:hypothetical protein
VIQKSRKRGRCIHEQFVEVKLRKNHRESCECVNRFRSFRKHSGSFCIAWNKPTMRIQQPHKWGRYTHKEFTDLKFRKSHEHGDQDALSFTFQIQDVLEQLLECNGNARFLPHSCHDDFFWALDPWDSRERLFLISLILEWSLSKKFTFFPYNARSAGISPRTWKRIVHPDFFWVWQPWTLRYPVFLVSFVSELPCWKILIFFCLVRSLPGSLLKAGDRRVSRNSEELTICCQSRCCVGIFWRSRAILKARISKPNSCLHDSPDSLSDCWVGWIGRRTLKDMNIEPSQEFHDTCSNTNPSVVLLQG